MRDNNGKFIRGTSGNPSGRKRLPKDLMQAINCNKEQLSRDVLFIENLTHEQLKQIDLSSLTMRQATILKAFRNCDHRSIKIYQDRVYGKATETTEIKAKLKADFSERKEIEIINTDEQTADLIQTLIDCGAIPIKGFIE